MILAVCAIRSGFTRFLICYLPRFIATAHNEAVASNAHTDAAHTPGLLEAACVDPLATPMLQDVVHADPLATPELQGAEYADHSAALGTPPNAVQNDPLVDCNSDCDSDCDCSAIQSAVADKPSDSVLSVEAFLGHSSKDSEAFAEALAKALEPTMSLSKKSLKRKRNLEMLPTLDDLLLTSFPESMNFELIELALPMPLRGAVMNEYLGLLTKDKHSISFMMYEFSMFQELGLKKATTNTGRHAQKVSELANTYFLCDKDSFFFVLWCDKRR